MIKKFKKLYALYVGILMSTCLALVFLHITNVIGVDLLIGLVLVIGCLSTLLLICVIIVLNFLYEIIRSSRRTNEEYNERKYEK